MLTQLKRGDWIRPAVDPNTAYQILDDPEESTLWNGELGFSATVAVYRNQQRRMTLGPCGIDPTIHHHCEPVLVDLSQDLDPLGLAAQLRELTRTWET